MSAVAVSGGWYDPGPVGPEDAAESAEAATRIRQAVDGLPAGQRAAVTHFCLAGMTYRETATALGIDITAVRTRLHKGRANLRRTGS